MLSIVGSQQRLETFSREGLVVISRPKTLARSPVEFALYTIYHQVDVNQQLESRKCQVYDFIIFRGQDIKDLTVLENGKQPGAAARRQRSASIGLHRFVTDWRQSCGGAHAYLIQLLPLSRAGLGCRSSSKQSEYLLSTFKHSTCRGHRSRHRVHQPTAIRQNGAAHDVFVPPLEAQPQEGRRLLVGPRVGPHSLFLGFWFPEL